VNKIFWAAKIQFFWYGLLDGRKFIFTLAFGFWLLAFGLKKANSQ